jgi:transposase
LRQSASITELCARYGISRKTAYKWIERYRHEGEAGLADRSRRPHRSPQATDPEVIAALLEARRRHPSWGADKLLSILRRRHADWELPARSTVNGILGRNGLIPAARPPRPALLPRVATAVNHVWSSVIGAPVRLADGSQGHVLTVADDFSRYLLACEALTSPQPDRVQEVFGHLFREFGLPLRIRSHARMPFAAGSLARLSTLSAWWVRLDIRPDWVDPRRELHAEVQQRVREDMRGAPSLDREMLQRRLNRLRSVINEDWLPTARYHPSTRSLPAALPPLHYPAHFEVRLVSSNGGIRWKSRWVNVSVVLAGETVGLEEFDDGIWNVFFGAFVLGRLDEREMRIRDVYSGLQLRPPPSRGQST